MHTSSEQTGRVNAVDVFGAIEAGGTKIVCAITTVEGELLSRRQFPTVDPRQTYQHALNYLTTESKASGSLRGIGIGHFGPICIDRQSPDYGLVLATPKKGWSGANVLAEVSRHTHLPVAIDTDVNCALRAEAKWGAGSGLDDLVYITVGTGIGAGLLSGGRVVKGQGHPEIGHMFLPAMDDDREFAGSCPYHGANCAEGLAAGPAISARWQADATCLDPQHPAWDLEARYLALLCGNLMLTTSPLKIILGGGVMRQEQLFPLVRDHFRRFLNDYVDLSRHSSALDDLIVPPGLGDDAGVLGAGIIAARFGS